MNYDVPDYYILIRNKGVSKPFVVYNEGTSLQILRDVDFSGKCQNNDVLYFYVLAVKRDFYDNDYSNMLNYITNDLIHESIITLFIIEYTVDVNNPNNPQPIYDYNDDRVGTFSLHLMKSHGSGCVYSHPSIKLHCPITLTITANRD